MTKDVVQVDALSKRYRRLNVIDSLSFEIREGEVFGLLGPNGAGKTTTMRLLTGLAFPTAGRMSIFGQPVPSQMRNVCRQIGAVIEEPSFYPHLTASHNLRVLGWASGIDVSSTALSGVLDRVGLADASARKVRHFSTGMKQRLGLAAALVHRPRLLILDEPTSGMDPFGVRDFRSLVTELIDEGHTIILSSHQLNDVERLCDRVLLIARGRSVAYGPLGELLAAGARTSIEVPDPTGASSLLEARDIAVTLEDGRLLVQQSLAADALRVMAGASIVPSSVTTPTPTLEELFIRTTGASAVSDR
jgi:ABC-2 type transport system ATP-binding protein